MLLRGAMLWLVTCSGCLATGAQLPVPARSEFHHPVAVAAPTPPPGPWSLNQLTAIALERHPELAAAYSRVEAARGQLIQAGLYPNPIVGWQADELGHKENGAGEQGPFLEQEIVTKGKLRLARAAAAQGVAIADWQAVTKRFEIITRVRTAHVDLLAARREATEIRGILLELEKEKDGRRGFLQLTRSYEEPLGFKSERLRVETEIAELNVRLEAATQRERAALRRLGTAIGWPELILAQIDLTAPGLAPIQHTYDQSVAMAINRSSELQSAQVRILQAQFDLDRAYAVKHPNIQMRVRPFRSFPEDDQRLMVEAGIPLPVFNANQGNILAAQADVQQAVAEARAVELRLIERLAEAYQRYETARQQALGYRANVQRAEESFLLAWAIYDKARAEELRSAFNSALDAYRNLSAARLAVVQAETDMQRAAIEIAGLVQE
jgi:cobalt-zinc-cadmium efflux system outer membrane protein